MLDGGVVIQDKTGAIYVCDRESKYNKFYMTSENVIH